jgi:hypothetical protein
MRTVLRKFMQYDPSACGSWKELQIIMIYPSIIGSVFSGNAGRLEQ